MRFKCSLNNNYEVIGLCDLKKFNQKINEFKDKSWTQLTLPKLINLPSKKPKIKSINKVFVGIKIISSNFMDTPVSNIANFEGGNLTGKLLLISGQINLNIIYTSDTKHNVVTSFKSINPFSTYIVLDETFDNNTDKYAIYPFIEDISLRKLEGLSLISNINLFLFAHKIKGKVPPVPPIPPEPPVPPPVIEKLPNKITIKSKTNEEVLTIEFDKNNRKFIVNSTNIIPDISSSEPYLTLILKNQNGVTLINAILNSNENGDNFKKLLNNKDFNYRNDTLIFVYKDKSKVEISNYPTQGEVYTPSLDFNIFSLEGTGLNNRGFKSKIKIINDDNKEMATVYFLLPTISEPLYSKIIVISTSAISTSILKPSEKYVEYLQYNGDNGILKGEILAGETSSSFNTALDDERIKIGSHILRLSNRVPGRISLTNFNGIEEYIVEEEPAFFLLADSRFIPHVLNYNKIKFKNNDGSVILYIYFDRVNEDTLYIEPYSIGVLNRDSNYFEFKILNPEETITKIQGRVNKNQTGDIININNPFNISKSFSFGDILEINSSNPSLVEMFNFPNGTSYSLNNRVQKFRITKDGLVLIVPPPEPSQDKLPNAFTFYSLNTSLEMGKIEFDRKNLKLMVSSTGTLYNGDITFNAFEFQLRSSNGTSIKTSSIIISNDNLNNFRDDLNNKDFEYGDLIYLGFFDSSKVTLSNYPSMGDTYKMKSFNSQGFKITENGIIPYILSNAIILNDVNNQPILRAQFDILTRKILITISGKVTNPAGGENYFKMTLYDFSGTLEKRSSKMTGGDNGIDFKRAFNNIAFQFGYVLELEYEERDKVLITNFPKEGALVYNPTGNKQYFEITEEGLVFGSISKTSIDVKSSLNQPLTTVNFNAFEKKFVVSSTFNIAYDEIGNEKYFSLTLKNPDETIKKEASIRGYGTSLPFREELNNLKFEYGDILNLKYKLNDKVTIANYPNFGGVYTPFLEEESFKITENGLKLAYDFLNNSIILKNISNKLLSIVKFNTTLKTLFVASSDEVSNILIGGREYFALVLKAFDGRIKAQNSVKGNQNTKGFKNALNNRGFEYGDIITLRYIERDKVSITNYPREGENFTPTGNSIDFRITQNGLEI